ncbi:MAG: DNA internalization-related competence protein ComEC/Rec2 [Luteitalea sp.]|nr:DNA internalization-related competence protein ComEC/Rec2 [Luteitalea sp.]
MRVVAAIPASGLLAGCAVGLQWPGVPHALLFALLIGLFAAAVMAFRAGRAAVLAASLATAFASGGALLASNAWHAAWRPTLRAVFESVARAERRQAALRGRQLPLDDSATVTLAGVLREDAAPGGAGVSLSLNVTGVAAPAGWHPGTGDGQVRGGVVLSVGGVLAPDHLHAWRRGRSIATTATLRRPSRYLDPGVPDHERALARRGTTLVGAVKSGALVEVTAPGNGASEAAASIRAFARRAIRDAVGRWSLRSAAIVTAIVIGDRGGLEHEVERRLQEAGTYHVIAISGGNIAILTALTLTLFRVAGLLGRGAMVCAIAGLVAYGYVVGGGVSVDRATLMAVIYLAGRALDLRGPPLNTLSLAAGILILLDPLAISDPAFLLTFGATVGILLVVPALPVWRLPRAAAPVVMIVAASAAAEAVLMPVGAAFFSRVTFAGLLLNLAAIPLMAVAQVAGMAVLPLFVVSGSVAAAAGWIAHAGAEGLVRSAGIVEWAPAVTWRVPPPSAATLAIYYLALITAWSAWRWRRRQPQRSRSRGIVGNLERAAVTAAIASALWILAAPVSLAALRGAPRLRVTFIDVGQGDAALVRFPNGSALAVDAGGPGGASFDIGDRVVAPVLRHEGLRRLDTIVLTHGDADHIGGAAALAREFRPWDIWEGVPVPRFEPLRTLQVEAAQRRIRWSTVQAGDLAVVDGVRLAVRHPDPVDWERQEVRNDDSIVIELLWRDVSVVLTGDIGSEVEQVILPRFAASPLRVVKVPHHGSLTSSAPSFVRALAPRVAVVSVGRSNTFGHPAPAVLRRYREAGAEVFRTDEDGAVTVETDGTSLEVRTFTGRRSLIVRTTADHEVTKDTTGTNDRGVGNG